MADIVMKRLTLAGMSVDKQDMLKKLAFFGAVEIKDAYPLLTEFDWIKATPDTADTYRLNSALDKINGAVAAVTPYAAKKGFLTARPDITKAEMEQAMDTSEGVLAGADEVLEIARKRDGVPSEIAKLESQLATLAPWLAVDVPLATTGTGIVDVMFGFFPSVVSLGPLDERISELPCYVERISADNNGTYVFAIVYKGASEECIEALREFSFSRLNFRDFKEVPAVEKAKIEEQVAKLREKHEAYTDELKAQVGKLPELQKLYDTLQGRIAMGEASALLLKADSVFYLSGYVPAELTEKLYNDFSAAWTVAMEFEDVTPEENPPVALKNNKFVQPYEMITEMYSLPAYGRFDPTAIMAPFFAIFFGIMFADVAYGLMMIVIGMIALKKMRPQGFAKSLFTLFIHGGVATAVAGLATGGFLGDVITVFSRTFLGKTYALPALIDPINDPVRMLIICCSFGIVQILVGLAVKAYIMIKDGDYLGALYDIGFWYVVFAGIAFTAMGISWGLYVLGGGAVGLVLTQGRAKTGIISKLFSGILSLYNITAYMADILSYSRLMALGIASAVISSVFNTMGALLGNSVLGLILFVVVVTIGHVLNFAINLLGSYVHSSRLQYVEFFGKFYEDGGRPFNPLKLKPKYHYLINEEEN